ncbi:DUF4349 domain-containing protein [Hymenobacter glacieicola]|uniref:DUF4349 domain-containing protein n=1 Tax=Hymenobacter glacieicola TaxID=1562124 RepID=A0ABQ1WRY1_9BACT|nr:DUF4349 domain-containing protein [Hymenobacter glacieicola]GGG42490.1 hypothetical protein GCM10011378_18570 [Hymenobacter glacieicola]
MKKYVRLLPFVGLMLAGCAQSAEQQELATTAGPMPEAATPELPNPVPPNAVSEVPLARLWRVAGHPVIYQGSMEVEVADFAAASARLDTTLLRRGAYLTSARETTDSDRHQQTLTIRVPSAQFLALTSELTQIGLVRGKELTSRNIAAELAKLRSAIRTSSKDTMAAQLSEQEIQRLTEQATLATLQLTYYQLRPTTELSPAAGITSQVQTGLWFGWRALSVFLIAACYIWPLLLVAGLWAGYRWYRGKLLIE